MMRPPAGNAHRRHGHRVLVAHPERDEARPCRLTFSSRGVLLVSERRPGTHRGPAPLRVPWWAVEGFSADHSTVAPDGRRLQVLELVTDAGTLELLCPCGEIGAVLARLAAWSRRWRVARSAPLRAAARLAVLWLAAASRLAGAVSGAARTRLASLRRQVGRLGRLGAPLGRVAALTGRRVAPLGRLAAPLGRILAPVGAPVGRRAAAAASAAAGPLAPAARVVARRPVAFLSIVVSLSLWMAFMLQAPQAPQAPPVPAAPHPAASPGFDASGMAQILTAAQFEAGAASHLVRATAPPPPAPPSVADAAPLGSHEVFGFAPYWTLATQQRYDVTGFTTIAYFAIAVNADGTLQQSGTGWDGYQSQAFADLVARAHAAGDRVVLTVNCFSQQALNQLTSSPAAAKTLATAVVGAIAAKNLDGVNIDFEGQGSGDQAGLTSLVSTVAGAVHAANPHYQVTMDTYASSAGDPDGFYDIPALAPIVDGFFVMSYNLNLAATSSPASPITSAGLSDAAAAAEYAAAVPPSKVIWGTSYFGYTWAATTGTMAATAMGTGVPVSYAQVLASGHPIYWDPVTQTAWTSYEVGTQWYVTYVEDPASVYLVAQMAQGKGFAGVGAWAMGMDGNDPQMTAALDGNVPPQRAGPAGPAITSQSAGAGSSPPATAPALTALAGLPGLPVMPTPTTAAPPTSQPTRSSGPGGASTTTTAAGGGTTAHRYSGTWKGATVSLTRVTATPAGTPTLAGSLGGFTTNDPALSCLASPGAPALDVWLYPGATTYLVIARQPTDCAAAELSFPLTATTAAAVAPAVGASSTRSTGGATPAASSSAPPAG